MIGKTHPGILLLRAGLLVWLVGLGVATEGRAEDWRDVRNRTSTEDWRHLRNRTRVPTRTLTPTATRTPTRTPIPTSTASRTNTPTQTNTLTRPPASTPTPVPTNTATRAPTNTATRAATNTATRAPTNTPVRTPTQGGGQINLISLHDSTSSHYNRNCTQCHADVPTEESLNPNIPSIHVVMRPYAPGQGNTQCVWCHRTVDLVQGVQSATKSKATLRKLVDPTVCSVCHLPGGPARQLYQTGPSRTNPDGVQLYGLVCEPCHGELARSEVRGESASEIWSHINENEGGMGPLGVLSTQQIQAIANALAQ